MVAVTRVSKTLNFGWSEWGFELLDPLAQEAIKLLSRSSPLLSRQRHR